MIAAALGLVAITALYAGLVLFVNDLLADPTSGRQFDLPQEEDLDAS